MTLSADVTKGDNQSGLTVAHRPSSAIRQSSNNGVTTAEAPLILALSKLRSRNVHRPRSGKSADEVLQAWLKERKEKKEKEEFIFKDDHFPLTVPPQDISTVVCPPHATIKCSSSFGINRRQSMTDQSTLQGKDALSQSQSAQLLFGQHPPHSTTVSDHSSPSPRTLALRALDRAETFLKGLRGDPERSAQSQIKTDNTHPTTLDTETTKSNNTQNHQPEDQPNRTHNPGTETRNAHQNPPSTPRRVSSCYSFSTELPLPLPVRHPPSFPHQPMHPPPVPSPTTRLASQTHFQTGREDEQRDMTRSFRPPALGGHPDGVPLMDRPGEMLNRNSGCALPPPPCTQTNEESTAASVEPPRGKWGTGESAFSAQVEGMGGREGRDPDAEVKFNPFPDSVQLLQLTRPVQAAADRLSGHSQYQQKEQEGGRTEGLPLAALSFASSSCKSKTVERETQTSPLPLPALSPDRWMPFHQCSPECDALYREAAPPPDSPPLSVSLTVPFPFPAETEMERKGFSGTQWRCNGGRETGEVSVPSSTDAHIQRPACGPGASTNDRSSLPHSHGRDQISLRLSGEREGHHPNQCNGANRGVFNAPPSCKPPPREGPQQQTHPPKASSASLCCGNSVPFRGSLPSGGFSFSPSSSESKNKKNDEENEKKKCSSNKLQVLSRTERDPQCPPQVATENSQGTSEKNLRLVSAQPHRSVGFQEGLHKNGGGEAVNRGPLPCGCTQNPNLSTLSHRVGGAGGRLSVIPQGEAERNPFSPSEAFSPASWNHGKGKSNVAVLSLKDRSDTTGGTRFSILCPKRDRDPPFRAALPKIIGLPSYSLVVCRGPTFATSPPQASRLAII
uniref:Uncharacterized protein n=1 Tax=Chromera velia CCMP2878 TaxID=1169474 RepID=A0A0G4I5B4_9ALVE|eukprot:Cvel_1852.t1-p1 / transcript=Cvel_1852.t1 / gene=Cvel_1852 / organism=Chromera_velia_CCMP2878 / gene_product=hypothetical protein / transcript_product=hypothetical protein / location=Cvel_scaffold68:129343-133375(-) / protein_length=845 / sequence_SO=supercontig / SO=protein_coding / is_pseudo=false